MPAPHPLTIISRSLLAIGAAVLMLYGYGFVKKKQKLSALTTELRSLTSDSSYFQQFYPEDARRTLVRAIAILAETDRLGMPTDTAIDRGLGIEPKFYENDAAREDPPMRDQIIRASLKLNYDNFRKLGYVGDGATLAEMRQGKLPPIPSGPHNGQPPDIATRIPPEFSAGIDRVVANLEIRPPRPADAPPSDIELAAARQLARDLCDARILEESSRDRILQALTPPPAAPAPASAPAPSP